MSSYLSVQQVLSAVLPTLQSVEVRTLAFSIDGDNCNLVTAVTFDERPAVIVRETSKAMLDSQAAFSDERLRIRFKVLPSSEWPELVQDFRSGIVVFDSESVNLMRPLEISESKGYIDRINFLRRFLNWPVFESHQALGQGQNNEASVAQKIRLVQHDQDLLRNLNANGYRSLNEVVQVFLQSRPDSEPSYESDVYVAIPICAAVRRPRFSPTERRLFVPFECNAHLRRDIRVFGERTLIPRGNERLLFSNPMKADDGPWVASAPFELGDETSGINVWLSHGGLGIITLQSSLVREIVPPEEINPLWFLLQAFCPSATFKTLLTSPPKPNDKRQKEQRSFEQHVAWFLALHGFSVVVLGEFETLRLAGSPVQQGSLDILAYHKTRKRVLMCSCTLTPPEERDYGNLVSLRSHLLSRVSPNVRFDTDLAIFSSAAECIPPRHYMTLGSYVAIFDQRELLTFLANLEAGNENQFFDKLEGTQFGIGWDDFQGTNDFDLTGGDRGA